MSLYHWYYRTFGSQTASLISYISFRGLSVDLNDFLITSKYYGCAAFGFGGCVLMKEDIFPL